MLEPDVRRQHLVLLILKQKLLEVIYETHIPYHRYAHHVHDLNECEAELDNNARVGADDRSRATLVAAHQSRQQTLLVWKLSCCVCNRSKQEVATGSAVRSETRVSTAIDFTKTTATRFVATRSKARRQFRIKIELDQKSMSINSSLASSESTQN